MTVCNSHRATLLFESESHDGIIVNQYQMPDPMLELRHIISWRSDPGEKVFSRSSSSKAATQVQDLLDPNAIEFDCITLQKCDLGEDAATPFDAPSHFAWWGRML